jgi:hypothetical protein
VTNLSLPQDRLTTGHRKEAQKAERFSGLICALLAVMATKGTNRLIDSSVHSYSLLPNTFCAFCGLLCAFVIEDADI